MRILRPLITLALPLALGACMQMPAQPDDPAYAPVMPRTPMPQELNNGAIYQPGFEISLYDDRKAHRVGDIITITLSERTTARKSADSEMSKDSSVSLRTPTLPGITLGTDLSASMGGSRSNNGESTANQSNSLTGSITVTVAEVLPNGILRVRGEKWMTLNTGNELVRISGLVRSDDVGPDNTVPSMRVADARITYSGTGAFANASQPGWLSQFFMSPMWPF
ncbi:MAG: flagellar basal body L-ring protein FlgH [Halopseudomonas yangmingensis]|uniref:Flagellar L-ring protein n=2 Tax=Halopseudomonas yangmingensis TaxID=1720063 RepID=A0A1I4T7W5_9GAMM|nr:flagellar basal body L-ring protein FlgH [Halopseudomonas yangmingensis]SFM72650.1 flagellar L-ring protein precursor FlgH [Halopseudomonas yangmingensis]